MDKLNKDVKDIVEKLGYYLYDITFGPRQEGNVLSVEIDHKNGIDIDDCVKVSEQLSDYLDDTDPISTSYSLEVTSAGAERELRTQEEIERAHGKLIYVETFDQQFQGMLETVDEASITIREKNKNSTTVLLADVQKIRLAIDL